MSEYKNMIHKIVRIVVQSIPILVMIALIPFVKNDYLLTAIYVVVILICLYIKKENKDITVFLCGFIAMVLSEYIFISTGVETFIRNSLFGLMPLWLPFLWGYAFIAIKRSVRILEK